MGIYLKLFGLIIALTVGWSCAQEADSKEKPPPPATVQNQVKETDLTTVTLTRDAVQRLGIETVAAEDRIMAQTQLYGAEVMALPGHSVTVTAPLSGTLIAPDDEFILSAGQKVAKGQPLYRLLLALPEKDLLSIRQEADLRQVELELAQKKVNRAQQLLADKAGSIKQLEEAQAAQAAAEAALRIAQIRIQLLKSGELDLPMDELPTLIIKSPIEGIVQNVHTAAGQTVTNATSLVEITNVDPVWIKVPVYVGALDNIDMEKPAVIQNLADLNGVAIHSANPIKAPLSADTQSSTADLYYQLSNTNAEFRPGQKVSVRLSLKDLENNLVVPYSALLYDMYGSAWIYENTEPLTYVRRRVDVHHVQDNYAVLSRGLTAGVEVVTAGAAELFGTEFGVGK